MSGVEVCQLRISYEYLMTRRMAITIAQEENVLARDKLGSCTCSSGLVDANNFER